MPRIVVKCFEMIILFSIYEQMYRIESELRLIKQNTEERRIMKRKNEEKMCVGIKFGCISVE